MPLVINGTTIEKVIYNGVELEKLVYNGVTVFEAAFSRTITLDGQHLRFDLAQHLLSLGWDGEKKVKVTVNLTGYCYSDDVAAYGMYIRDLPAGSEVDLIIASTGSIRGKGGQGYGNKIAHPDSGGAGERGGHALYVGTPSTVTVRVDNQGWIGGGGGGGGANIPPSSSYNGTTQYGGGGGAGTNSGIGGEGHNASGAGGTATSGGAGATIIITGSQQTFGGGNGGGRGQAGFPSFNPSGHTGPGGAGGSSVVGNNRITWVNVGTLYGNRVNN